MWAGEALANTFAYNANGITMPLTLMDTIDDLIDQAKAHRRLPPPARRRAIRERAGVTQPAIAKVIGTSAASVCRWEHGDRTPRGHTLRRYLDVLDRLASETLK